MQTERSSAETWQAARLRDRLAPPGNTWTALMLWHLKRYLLPALHAVAGDRQLKRHRPASVYRRVPTLEPRRTPANARQDR